MRTLFALAARAWACVVVDSPGALGEAHEVIGTLEVTHKADSADATRDSVVSQLSRTARRRGCDHDISFGLAFIIPKFLKKSKNLGKLMLFTCLWVFHA